MSVVKGHIEVEIETALVGGGIQPQCRISSFKYILSYNAKQNNFFYVWESFNTTYLRINGSKSS